MRELPLSIRLDTAPQTPSPPEIVCHCVLRVLPGKREVFDASWGGRDVIVKVFYHPLKAWRHCQREAAGLRQLARRGIEAPAVLFAGRTLEGHWAVVTDKIADAVSLAEVREGFGDPQRREEIMRRAAALLARMHRSGVLQLDFHLSNFLLQGERLIVIDPAQIRFTRRPVSRRRALAQLARLARILLWAEPFESAEPLYEEYARVRGWRLDEPTRAKLRRAYRRGRSQGIRRSLKRLLRKGNCHIRMVRSGYRAVLRQDLLDAGGPEALLECLDDLIASGGVLRSDGLTLVAQVAWAHRPVIVKRFEEAGWRGALAGHWSGSDARRRWLAAHQLCLLGIAAAPPLAFIERNIGVLRQRSYLLTEKMEGQTLLELLRGDEVPPEGKQHAVRQLARALETMANHGLTYRAADLNDILVSRDQLVFTAFGGLTRHWWPGRCRREHARELGRLAETLRAAGLDIQESDLRVPGGTSRGR